MRNLRPTCEFFATRRFIAENIKSYFFPIVLVATSFQHIIILQRYCNVPEILKEMMYVVWIIFYVNLMWFARFSLLKMAL